MDQQIGDDQCSFYSSLYDVIEAELFCDHWGSRCCLSCVMMRMKQAQKAKETKSHGKDQVSFPYSGFVLFEHWFLNI